jgi:membrane protease YdiL (CAAX protease family)
LREGRPSWWGTLLYPAALVSLFLLGQVLLGAAGVPLAQAPALAAVPAVLALVLSLPVRLRRAWGCATPWRRLGLCARPALAARALLGGLGQAALLLALVIAALALAHALQWQPRLSGPLLLNALLLGLGVGLVEELLFRGWLLGELTLQLGARRAWLLQAAVFSLVHLRFNLEPGLLLGLLSGLLLLGMALGLRRRADQGALWGAIGLHGGLVGGWFVLLQGVVITDPAAPAWLMGPANPIGGLAGVLGLALLVGWLIRKGDSRPSNIRRPEKPLKIYH